VSALTAVVMCRASVRRQEKYVDVCLDLISSFENYSCSASRNIGTDFNTYKIIDWPIAYSVVWKYMN
jgi:hypothetical protein